MIQEKDLTGEVLKNKINEILNDEELIKEVKIQLEKISIDNSSSLIYDEICKLLK